MKRRRRCGARPRGASLRSKAVLRTASCCGAFEYAAQRKYGPGRHAVGDRFGALPPLAEPDGGPVQRAEERLGGAPGRPGGGAYGGQLAARPRPVNGLERFPVVQARSK